MNTQDVERAIAQCQKFFVSTRTGRAVYEFADLRETMKANGVDHIDNVTNNVLGSIISKLGGFTLSVSGTGGERRSTVQAAPERIERLRAQVKSYVSKPSKKHPGVVKVVFGNKHVKRARF